MKQVEVEGAFITLGQLLKVVGLIETGGHARHYLSEQAAMVNGETEARRGRKLFPGDQVELPGESIDLIARREATPAA